MYIEINIKCWQPTIRLILYFLYVKVKINELLTIKNGVTICSDMDIVLITISKYN